MYFRSRGHTHSRQAHSQTLAHTLSLSHTHARARYPGHNPRMSADDAAVESIIADSVAAEESPPSSPHADAAAPEVVTTSTYADDFLKQYDHSVDYTLRHWELGKKQAAGAKKETLKALLSRITLPLWFLATVGGIFCCST